MQKKSLNNILNPHFAVLLKALPTQGTDLDDDAPDDLQRGGEFDERPRPGDVVQQTVKKLSIFLSSLAIYVRFYDSKKLIGKEIRKRRAQITALVERQAEMRTKQQMVDMSAS